MIAAYKIVIDQVMTQVKFLLKLTPTNHKTPISTTAQNVLSFIQEMHQTVLLERVIMKKKAAVLSRTIALNQLLLLLKNTELTSVRQFILTFFAPYIKQIGYHYMENIQVIILFR